MTGTKATKQLNGNEVITFKPSFRTSLGTFRTLALLGAYPSRSLTLLGQLPFKGTYPLRVFVLFICYLSRKNPCPVHGIYIDVYVKNLKNW